MGGANPESDESIYETYCLDIKTNRVYEKKNLIQSRYGHGICFLNNFIYVTAGVRNAFETLKCCERYNLIDNYWASIPDLPNPRFAMTLIAMEKRYIYMFGGHE